MNINKLSQESAKYDAKKIFHYLDKMYEFKNQEKWDNSLAYINNTCEINKIMVCLDINKNIYKIAIQSGVQLIISHHPMFINPISQKNFHIRKLLGKLKSHNISVIFLHTPFDKSDLGMNKLLAIKLGLSDIKKAKDGMSTIGTISPMKLSKFAKYSRDKLNSDNASYLARHKDKIVQKVAICGGSASENMFDLIDEEYDVFVTCDVKHHAWVDSVELNVPIISLNHNIENVFVDEICEKLQQIMPECDFIKAKSALNIVYI